MREWVSEDDHRWVMRCDVERADGTRCPTTSEPSNRQPPLPLLVAGGWFVAELSGDICPACLARGYVPTVKPHPDMATAGGN